MIKRKKLGQGAFGVVYLMQRRSDSAMFAMKEIDLRKPVGLDVMVWFGA